MEQKEKQEEKDLEENNEEEVLDENTIDAQAEMVEDTAEEPSDEELDLEATLAQAEEYKDKWMRSEAEFQNYRKRVDRDQVKMREDATAHAVKKFLDVLDDLDRALLNRPTEGEGAEWAEGIELIIRKLNTILENQGVTQMQAEGEQFDPNLHEAISQEESEDHESGQIIEVLQKGYMIGDRVLRPALVRIAS